jgi:hypothetical protein
MAESSDALKRVVPSVKIMQFLDFQGTFYSPNSYYFLLEKILRAAKNELFLP